MPFQVSPGVNVSEIDLTTIVPAVSTTEGAIAGAFRWGPIEKRVLIDSEVNMVSRFGKPSNYNPETWFTAANFLTYGNRLYVSRAAKTTGVNTAYLSSGANTDNTSLLFIATNTSGLSVGDILYYSNNAGLPVGASIATIVNASAVTLSRPMTIAANVSDVNVTFRNDIVYTSVAPEFSNTNINWLGQIVKNEDAYDGITFNGDLTYVARFPGSTGNSLKVSVCDTATQYSSVINATAANANVANVTISIASTVGSVNVVFTATPNTTSNAAQSANASLFISYANSALTVGDLIEVGNTTVGFQSLKVLSKTAIANVANVVSFTVTLDDQVKLVDNVVQTSATRYWEYYNVVDTAPGQSDYQRSFGNTSVYDELHVVVSDAAGAFTGVPGTILEVYNSVSRATDSKTVDGGANYYKEVINQGSQYIYWAGDRSTAVSNTAAYLTNSTSTSTMTINFVGGSDGPDEANIALGDLTKAYDLFASAEDVDISLILQGKARGTSGNRYVQLGNYLIDNIAEKRKDCVVFISPDKSYSVNNSRDEADDIVLTRNLVRSTSYGFMDSGHKYMYDRYNDVYRYVPLNGDIAGLCVRTDNTNDPWYSPAGFNRGQIKNIVRLAYSPAKADRDTLYKAGVNPVVTFPGQGTILFGDKTLLSKPSAFDRINVRRLFIVLEKAIATASKYTLFEFNDDFTRAQFKNLINPYLRDVQGRRGITDFLIVCDTTNNTPEVIDRNEFIGDIYIKPARSINFIQLNFVAVRTGVSFSEVVGKF